MDHILLWAAIALFILILGAIWKWLRKLQTHSRRRRGNNYLYQDYNYDDYTDNHAIDLAWESHRENIQSQKQVEDDLKLDLDLDLDSEQPNNNDCIVDVPWESYQDRFSLHQVIGGYVNLEIETESPKPNNSQENCLPVSSDRSKIENSSGKNGEHIDANSTSINEGSEARDDY